MSGSLPFRTTDAVGQGVWKVYGEDSAGQERYLGRLRREGGLFKADGPCVEFEDEFDSRREAARILHKKCLAAGYLKKGHKNYLSKHPVASNKSTANGSS